MDEDIPVVTGTPSTITGVAQQVKAGLNLSDPKDDPPSKKVRFEKNNEDYIPKGTDPSIEAAVLNHVNDIRKVLVPGEGVVKDKFFVKKIIDNHLCITVPANFDKLLEYSCFQAVYAILSEFNLPFRVTEDKLELNADRPEVTQFLQGAYNRTQPGETVESCNFSGTKPYEQGRIYVDTMACTIYSGIPSIQEYLPSSTRSATGFGLIKAACMNLAGSRSVKTLNDLPNLLGEKIKENLKNNEVNWQRIVNNTTVPYGLVIEKNLRKKTIKSTKPGQPAKHTTIHLKKPSQCVESIWSVEKEHFKTLEGPWDILSGLAKKYEKGVPIADIIKIAEAHKEAYAQQFDITSSLNSFRSARRDALNNVVNDFKKKQTATYNAKHEEGIKDFILELLELRDKDISKEMALAYNGLRPLYLVKDAKLSWIRLTSFEVIQGYVNKNIRSVPVDEEKFGSVREWLEEVNPKLTRNNICLNIDQNQEWDNGYIPAQGTYDEWLQRKQRALNRPTAKQLSEEMDHEGDDDYGH